jgi:hypothetical protein
MGYDVFLSHASQDKPVAERLVVAMENAGISCWIAPRNVTAGVPYEQEILDAIHNAKVMVLVFSSHTNQSQHVAREVGLAMGQRVSVIPFMIEDVGPAGSLEYFLDTTHRLAAHTPPLEGHFGSLVRAVYVLIAKQHGAPQGGSQPPPMPMVNPVPAAPPVANVIATPPTNPGGLSRSYYAPDLNLGGLIQALGTWLQGQGYEFQSINHPAGELIVQARKSGGWRIALGISSALNVVFRYRSPELSVEIGEGKWADKAFAMSAGMFVLWPLAVTAAWGAWQQNQLPKRAFEFIDQVIRTQAPRPG